MNNGLSTLLQDIVDPFREKARGSDGDDHSAPVERGADELIPINLQGTRIVFNPGFLLYICHSRSFDFAAL
jgi:hypothetical protein